VTPCVVAASWMKGSSASRSQTGRWKSVASPRKWRARTVEDAQCRGVLRAAISWPQDPNAKAARSGDLRGLRGGRGRRRYRVFRRPPIVSMLRRSACRRPTMRRSEDSSAFRLRSGGKTADRVGPSFAVHHALIRLDGLDARPMVLAWSIPTSSFRSNFVGLILDGTPQMHYTETRTI